jgi:hypothetical protein
MKKQLILSLSLFSLLTLVLLNCKKKEDPTPGSSTGGNNTSLAISAVNPASGTAGTKVVITGTGFSTTLSANTVKFGSIAAILDSASATRLVTKVPKDATTGKITVEVGGKTATSSSDFSITQAPPTFSGTGSAANVPVSVTTTTAAIATTIDKEGSKSIIQHGHVWSSTKSEPTLKVAATEGKTELGTVPANATFPYKFTSDLKDLDPATTYNVRAYVKTGEGTTYGPVSQVQSKKPCVLTTITTSSSSVPFNYDNQSRLTGSSNTTFSYNAEGLLSKYELKQGTVTVSETYTYSQGRLSKIEFQSGAINRTTNYDYDAQGKLIKETIVSGDITTEYTYNQDVLISVKANKGAIYTVKDGNVITIDNGNGNYTAYEFDARRNQTKIETFTSGKQARIFEYAYDDKPSVGFFIYTFKGWLPQQILKGAFLSGSNTGYNNWTERKYQSATSKETAKRAYTYQKDRVTGYTETVTDTMTGLNYTNKVSHNYTGDCEN